MMILGGIPAKEDHKAPGKSLAADDIRRHGKILAGAAARPLLGAWQDPCWGRGKALAMNPRRATIRPTPIKPPPPFACSCRPNQLGRHLRGGKQILVETHPCATSATCLPTWHR